MKTIRSPYVLVLGLFVLLLIMHVFEYFVMRTDQSFWGEAFVHKLLGIGILFAVLPWLGLSARAIGFDGGAKSAWRGFSRGLGLGMAIYALVYFGEWLLLYQAGLAPTLSVYVSAYAIDGNVGQRTGAIFFVLCVLGNLINVCMEEGVFRGLFQKVLETRHSALMASVLASALFGLWHGASPFRSWLDGQMSGMDTIIYSVMLMVTATLVGFKFAILTRISGSLWFAMGDHFANNFLINVLHITSDGGTDAWLSARVGVAQTLSFVVVAVWYWSLYGRKGACPSRR